MNDLKDNCVVHLQHIYVFIFSYENFIWILRKVYYVIILVLLWVDKDHMKINFIFFKLNYIFFNTSKIFIFFKKNINSNISHASIKLLI